MTDELEKQYREVIEAIEQLRDEARTALLDDDTARSCKVWIILLEIEQALLKAKAVYYWT